MTQQHEHDSGPRLWPYALGGLAMLALSAAASAGYHYSVSASRDLWALLVWVPLVGWVIATGRFTATGRYRVGVGLLGLLVAAVSVSGFAYVFLTAQDLPCLKGASDAGFGEPARVGGREYVLTQAGGDPPRTPAITGSPGPLGEWFVVYGSATNVAERPIRLDPARTALVVCDVRYQADAALTTTARSLNPGLTAVFVAVFDVPPGFPNGETVAVRLYGASNKYTEVHWDGWGSVT